MATPAYAQRINSSAQGTFGQVQLREGFMPDPHVVTVNAGGPIDVATVSDNCRLHRRTAKLLAALSRWGVSALCRRRG